MTIKEMFNKAITDAFKSAYLITEEDKKAVALAQIATALAQTGAIAPSDIEDNSEKAEEKEETKEKADEKKSYKPKKKQGEKLQKQPYDLSDEVPDEASEKTSNEAPEETPNEASEDPEEVEMAEEWTDETMKKYDPELTYIEDFNERNDPDGSTKLLDSCVEEYSSGVLHSFEEDITPRNVVSFVSWLKDVESSASEEKDS